MASRLTSPPAASSALIGPDGVGKSTLLGMIAGARQIQSGRVAVLGGDMRRCRPIAPPICPRIAYMPQGLGKNLYPDLSVRENIDFFGRLFGQGRAERDSAHRRPARQPPAWRRSPIGRPTSCPAA